jgi:alkanesulfonate monooxygenase SsuD/methylene tetrahydromethanopterin reductase-like flavin-dependent oxidoreductase (luciferase family)
MQGHAVTLSALAKKHNMSLRELRDFTAGAMGHRLLCGTPEQVADGLEEWFVAGAADGFNLNLMPPWFPGAFDEFRRPGRADPAAAQPVPHRVRRTHVARSSWAASPIPSPIPARSA